MEIEIKFTSMPPKIYTESCTHTRMSLLALGNCNTRVVSSPHQLQCQIDIDRSCIDNSINNCIRCFNSQEKRAGERL